MNKLFCCLYKCLPNFRGHELNENEGREDRLREREMSEKESGVSYLRR